MPSERPSSTPATSMTPGLYCRKCGYALIGLQSSTCPECGRGFDLGDPRTFAHRPPRGWFLRWGRRVLAVGLLLVLAAGVGLLWLWWGWLAEQSTIARLGVPGVDFQVAPIGPPRLRSVLGVRWGYLTDRVDWAWVQDLGAAETEQLDFQSFTHIERLQLLKCELSNRHLNHLAGLAKLEDLRLEFLRIEKPDLAFLEKLPALTTLYLLGEWVASAGFEHVGRLGHLKGLYLSLTGLTDDDLQDLRGLYSLEELNLKGNPISDAGLAHLQGLKSLKRLWVDPWLVDSPGMAKLKQAIPGLQVTGHGPSPH